MRILYKNGNKNVLERRFFPYSV